MATGAAARQQTVWPLTRRRPGIVTPVDAFTAHASVPLPSDAARLAADEWREERVTDTRLVELHSEIAEEMLPWAIALFLVRLAQRA